MFYFFVCSVFVLLPVSVWIYLSVCLSVSLLRCSTSAAGDTRIEQQVNQPSLSSAPTLPPSVTRVSRQWVLCCCLIYFHPSSLCSCTRVDSPEPPPGNSTPYFQWDKSSAIWADESSVWNSFIQWCCKRDKKADYVRKESRFMIRFVWQELGWHVLLLAK